MTRRTHLLVLPLLAALGLGYAVWTQPLLGPESAASAAARALLLAAWLAGSAAVLHFRLEHWSWRDFLLGFASGGAWIPFVLTDETLAEMLPIAAMGVAYGTVSGLYAATARGPVRAVLTGLVVFLGQFLVDFAVATLGMSRIHWGM